MKFRVMAAAVAVLFGSVTGASSATAIVNGVRTNEAGPHVALAWVNDQAGQVFCSGTVIDARWVLTAAHCRADQPPSGTELRVLAGDADLFSDPNTIEILGVIRVITHPLWSSAEPADAFDVTLLELAEPTSSPPASLPETAIDADTNVVVWGFGATNSGLTGSGVLRFAERAVAQLGGQPGDPFFTLRDSNQLCTGDSGGAVTHNGVLVGVNSFIFSVGTGGSIDSSDCAPGGGAGHAAVYDVVEWISETVASALGDNSACRNLRRTIERIPAAKGAAAVGERLKACAVNPGGPVELEAAISPTLAFTTDDLTCVPTGGTEPFGYTWNVNGVVVGGENSNILPSARHEKGNTVTCEITDDLAMTASDSVQIANSAPEVTSLTITPSFDGTASTTDDLICSASATDADGDTLTIIYEWFVLTDEDGDGFFVDNDTLASDFTQPGYVATCLVAVSDGAGGVVLDSVEVAIVVDDLDGRRFAQISAGTAHTCAVTTTGQAYCWGRGAGRLGNGSTDNQSTPVPVTTEGIDGLTDTNVAHIAAGNDHTCAVTTTGKVYCWGDGYNGQLGNGSTTTQLIPVPVTTDGIDGLTDTNVAHIAAGAGHTCAVTTTGRAYCWGGGNRGQLGNGSIDIQLTPVPVTTDGIDGLTDSNVAQISARVTGLHTCAVTTTGKAYCWGRGDVGQLGNGSTNDQLIPVPVTNVGGLADVNVAQITAGGLHTCAVTTTGKAYCWGSNLGGRLGNPTADEWAESIPVPVSTVGGLTDTNVAQITAGGAHTCAVTTAGKGYCWGAGDAGRLGNGSTDHQSSPEPVVTTVDGLSDTNAAHITAGNEHTCALTTIGKAYCWGAGNRGQLGNGSTDFKLTPVPVTDLE
jgi:alpha-tubulin suppressor-like RCC1 family protein